LWIEPAFRLDIAGLLAALQKRWQQLGYWQDDSTMTPRNHPRRLTIKCIGAGELASEDFDFVGLRAAKGEIIDLDTTGLNPGVILNRRHWLLPLSSTRARVGATFSPNDLSPGISASAAAELRASACALLGRSDVDITAQVAGTRVTTADKHPVVGRHPADPFLGIVNGLGSKGALLAPWLAVQWAQHLQGKIPFDSAVDVARFWKPA
jgi:glycine oxidase